MFSRFFWLQKYFSASKRTNRTLCTRHWQSCFRKRTFCFKIGLKEWMEGRRLGSWRLATGGWEGPDMQCVGGGHPLQAWHPAAGGQCPAEERCLDGPLNTSQSISEWVISSSAQGWRGERQDPTSDPEARSTLNGQGPQPLFPLFGRSDAGTVILCPPQTFPAPVSPLGFLGWVRNSDS